MFLQTHVSGYRARDQDSRRDQSRRYLDTRVPTVRNGRSGQTRRRHAVHVLDGPIADTGQVFQFQFLGRSGVQMVIQVSRQHSDRL